MDYANTVGFAGVFILLVAFFLSIFKIIKQESKIYTILNMVGAGLAGYSAYLVKFIPFVVLEAVWAIVALIGFLKLLKKG